MMNNKKIVRKVSKSHVNRNVVGRLLQISMAFVFLLFVGRFLYLSISKTIAGENISERVSNLYKRDEILKSVRGAIYDNSGNVIAEDSHSFTLYAILDKSSLDYKGKPMYVVDKKKTAEKLSTVIPLSEKKILKYLHPKHKAYQVEFGTAGSGISLATKKKIMAMHLPGIHFDETPSRLYPNGRFASHIIGIAQPFNDKKNHSINLIGTMGIEKYFNKVLSGKDGRRIALVDAGEYQLPGGQHSYKAPINGNNIYLTIDSQLQIYLENLLDAVQNKYKPKALTAIVEDVKTGKIMAASQRPTFDPATRKGLNDNWRNILVQDSYEPGSVFKILSITAAIQEGKYNPKEYYRSGSITFNGSTIHDWNYTGWGAIPFEQAFPRSSNVGMSILVNRLGRHTWRRYLDNYHIGKKTNITLPDENSGLINIHSQIDQAVTSFGQGINVNAMQMMQVYSALANSGQMLKPQLVEKIVSSSGKVIKRYKKIKVGKPVYSQETAQTTLKLMRDVVEKEYGTGMTYKIPGKSIAVKTGTAQIAGIHGGYLKGDRNYLFSVVGLTPADNPRYCIYITMKQPQIMSDPPETIMSLIFKPLINRVSVSSKVDMMDEQITIPSVKGQSREQAVRLLEKMGLYVETIGSGHKVEAQSILANTKVNPNSKIIIFTGGIIRCPNMKGWTIKQVTQFANISKVKVEVLGKGKVYKQSRIPRSILNRNSKVKVELR
ncbi:penicillin-binding transpeptidase domain-containing protein [Lactobacillus iners]|uniref:Penicillin-binding protein, transpeptidase domain protein n=1 Tax=Lactobacillus iners DSM 13335 TaxID=525328 RepID=C8PDJ1_9LACO|nr:penicillin-binding transpeptidase domain-containing protein [Lactobacillus iners]EEW51431.1 penicillin-binding protein, transpeptidase domain protein [Lactobacillus iners DSM 13335]EFQ49629.1 penicillin-binding protein, transpeptidase domain protein [Lactobacillus iners LEAF 2052A-d]KRL60527.1 penicillin-binding protein [Lactobacillus iners DSM 13335]MDK7306525.1 penicillin-binding transpeptidase domain-containing protein [Lactobacillus iners]QFZ99701.1 PASTA domain-containing protein [Lact